MSGPAMICVYPTVNPSVPTNDAKRIKTWLRILFSLIIHIKEYKSTYLCWRTIVLEAKNTERQIWYKKTKPTVATLEY